MFTGIVQGRGRVARAADHDGIRTLWIALPPGRDEGLISGASVAVAGVCLTAVTVEGGVVQFDCIDETLRRSTLGALTVGAEVNVERAARFGDEIGGHFLSGHVFSTGVVARREETDGNLALWIAIDADTRRCVLPKGYVAVDGVSLTVGAVDGDVFDVHLIPETRRVTTLDGLRVGDRVNIEIDALTQAAVDTVERVLAAIPAGGAGTERPPR